MSYTHKNYETQETKTHEIIKNGYKLKLYN